MTVSEDFTRLTGRFRGGSLAHRCRMPGSSEEDPVQETSDPRLPASSGLPQEYRAAARPGPA